MCACSYVLLFSGARVHWTWICCRNVQIHLVWGGCKLWLMARECFHVHCWGWGLFTILMLWRAWGKTCACRGYIRVDSLSYLLKVWHGRYLASRVTMHVWCIIAFLLKLVCGVLAARAQSQTSTTQCTTVTMTLRKHFDFFCECLIWLLYQKCVFLLFWLITLFRFIAFDAFEFWCNSKFNSSFSSDYESTILYFYI